MLTRGGDFLGITEPLHVSTGKGILVFCFSLSFTMIV